MTRQILVAVRRPDQIREVTPILQKIAKPGGKVTFLLPYPVNPWSWLRDHWITTESRREAMLEAQRILARYSWDEQKRMAEEMISVAREALSRMDVEVAVELKGRLNSAVRAYVLTGEFQLLLMAPGTGRLAMELIRLSILWLRRINRPGFSAFRLYHSKLGTGDARPMALISQLRGRH